MQIYIEKMIKELKQKNYSLRTVEIYTQCVKYYVDQWIKNDISKISRENIIDFVLFLQSKGKAPKTINVYKEAILFFVREILKIKFDDIRLSKEPLKLPIVLAKSEIEKMIASITNIKHKTMIALTYWSWLRVSELINLKVSDIDFENNFLHIKNARWFKDRITVLPEKIRDDLMSFCEEKDSGDFVFISERGGSLTTRTLQHVFTKALNTAWIKKDATFHSLRHSFATHLLENWTDIRYIQELLWHANIRTTQVYTKVTKPNILNIKSPL